MYKKKNFNFNLYYTVTLLIKQYFPGFGGYSGYINYYFLQNIVYIITFNDLQWFVFLLGNLDWTLKKRTLTNSIWKKNKKKKNYRKTSLNFRTENVIIKQSFSRAEVIIVSSVDDHRWITTT